ncbi:MAG: radical SAM/SPASM domain-containing protein [Candidatus Micrarchaeia archaeon]
MNTTKLAKLGLTALKSNFTTLERPYKLTFSISYWCQSRCLTCNIWQIKPVNELTFEEIQNFAKKNNFFKWIELTGGEPFLRKEIVEIVKTFRENCKDLTVLTMPTNSLCNHDMLENKLKEILELGIPKISITLSLDGHRELHDKIRGVNGNFDKVMDMAKRLHELKKKYKNLFFIFGYTMSKFNQGMLEKTITEVIKELPWVTFNDFHLNVGQISDSYYKNSDLDISAERQELSKEIDFIIKKRRFEFGAIPIIENAFLRNLNRYVLTNKIPMKSRSLDASLFMDSYGNVYPSIMWGRKIGNIRDYDYSIEKMWHGVDAEEVRNLIREGKEPSCWTACEAYQCLVGDVKRLIF